jgi:hypothetical protein
MGAIFGKKLLIKDAGLIIFKKSLEGRFNAIEGRNGRV